MTRAILSCLVVLVWVGCTSQEEPQRGAFATPRPPAERVPPTPRPTFFDTPEPEERATPALQEEEQPEEEKDKRNLGEEIRVAVGTPLDCVRDFQAETATTIRIPVSATVRPTGMVIQPSAAGTGVSAAALRCVEQRVSVVKLSPLDEPLSKTVSTVIEMDYTPPVVVESEGGPEPVLRKVREPLPKRAEVAASGRPIQEPTSRPITDPPSRDPNGPSGRPIRGPKPRAIDGYQVDENAKQWR